MGRVLDETPVLASFPTDLLVIEILELLDRYSPDTNLKQTTKKQKVFEYSEMGGF
jgi:hypothetical protein